MNVELDHVFIFCKEGAPEAALLVERGLLEGSPNTHPGQGTANRRFFFANAYLELLWVSDQAEAQREDVLPTQLWERWSCRTEGACPFGIVFRPRSDSTGETPFSSWSYRPAYLPTGLSIEVGRELMITEPQLFFLPFARHREPTGREPTAHPAGIERPSRAYRSRFRLALNRPILSPALSMPASLRYGEDQSTCLSSVLLAPCVRCSISDLSCRCCSAQPRIRAGTFPAGCA